MVTRTQFYAAIAAASRALPWIEPHRVAKKVINITEDKDLPRDIQTGAQVSRDALHEEFETAESVGVALLKAHPAERPSQEIQRLRDTVASLESGIATRDAEVHAAAARIVGLESELAFIRSVRGDHAEVRE